MVDVTINIDKKLLQPQADAVLRCIEDTKEDKEEKLLLEGVWNLLMTLQKTEAN